MFGEFGGGQVPALDSARVVHVATPLTSRMAKTWVKLQKEVTFSFPNEVPFEEFLKNVRELTRGQEDKKGISIYIDPIGLQNAEKTINVPVTLDLEDVPIATGFEMVLKQLGLMFYVQKDGVVVITNEDSEAVLSDPMVKVLEELETIRNQVGEIKDSRPVEVSAREVAKEISNLRAEIVELRQTLNTLKIPPHTGQASPTQTKP